MKVGVQVLSIMLELCCDRFERDLTSDEVYSRTRTTPACALHYCAPTNYHRLLLFIGSQKKDAGRLLEAR